MGLMGTLDTMSLGDLLQWISTARKSGVVTVAQGKSRLQLAVAGSRILGSYSNEPPMLLGQFLLSPDEARPRHRQVVGQPVHHAQRITGLL
ncbi:MAG: DUF4388 domain-containing protein [Acidobacteria bacterium]|nr:DUF4388 domain-containing protein [Acidobacteriota bacterium]